MRLADIADVVGQRVVLDDGPGLIVGTAGWSPCYLRVQLDSGGTTVRQAAHLLPLLSNHHRRSATVPASAKSRPAKQATAAKAVPKKSKLAVAMDSTDAELAEFLLANPTYSDASWKERAGNKSRRKGESREAFIRRVLLGEEPAS